MNRPDRPWLLRELALFLLLILGQSTLAHADTRCVNTVSEFILAYENAEDEDQTINVVAGTYTFATDPGITVAYTKDLKVVGGWNSNCSARQPDPRLTVFTGTTDRIAFHGEESITVESIAVVDTGRVVVSTRDGDVRLERVWLENVCAGDGRCGDQADDPVVVSGTRTQLSQVVAIDNRATGCAVRIPTHDLVEASVQFSLFSGNQSHGLCVRSTGIGGSDEYTLLVQNSIFWDNLQDDLLTRDSPLITLQNNVYQSVDMNPATSIGPVQSLNVDPLFQNAAAGDFRLQAASPAVNTGRLLSLFVMPDQDLDGGQRFIGSAPDRGPFESTSTESTFQVTNTLDTTSPVATGSLRWAIEQANENPGLDRIRFALPDCPRIIELNALLPDITDSVFIDGYSQAGSERNTAQRSFTPTLCVGVRDSALALDHALRIPSSADDNTFLWVSGLAFGGFDIAAVRIAAGSSTWVFGNQFGGELGGNAVGTNAVNVRFGGTSHDNVVGGLEVSQRNLISSAYVAGVELLDNGSGDEGYGHSVRNNLIGLTASGNASAPNAIGVRVRTHNNSIEDTTISGNQGDGVLIEGELAFNNDVRSNDIGRKTFAFCLPPCTPDYALGNIGAGVRVSGGGDNNSLYYNRIAFNGDAGVRFEDGERNLVFANEITSNDGLGIDLGANGVNPSYNSSLVVTGTYANRGINAPTLTAAGGDGSGGEVSGQLLGRNGEYLVQIFRNSSCDASGRGEGLEMVATAVLTISNAQVGENGSATFTAALPDNLTFNGRTLTALVTDNPDNSSEFSACRSYQTVQCREIFKDGMEDSPSPATCTPP